MKIKLNMLGITILVILLTQTTSTDSETADTDLNRYYYAGIDNVSEFEESFQMLLEKELIIKETNLISQ